MKYRILQHQPSPLASTYLHDIYELQNDEQESIYGCIPGAEIGISLVLSGESHIYVHNHWVKQPSAIVYGGIRHIQFHKMSAGYREICIGFTPPMLHLFTKTSMDELTSGRITDLHCLYNRYSVEELYDGVRNATGDIEILRSIEKFLAIHLIDKKEDKRITSAYKMVMEGNTQRVAQVAEAANISGTALRTLFRERIGCSPKQLMTTTRIRNALRNTFPDEESLTGLAYVLGYFDQSHFIHEFKDVIGLTPKQYFNNESLTFDFYNYERWKYSSFGENLLKVCA